MMIKKILTIVLAVIILIGTFATIGYCAIIKDFYTNQSMKVVVNKQANIIYIDGVKFYTNINKLKTDIGKAKKIKIGSAISSDCIYKDGCYHKYDIFKDNGITLVVFYKFEDETDDRFPMPAFDSEIIAKAIIK